MVVIWRRIMVASGRDNDSWQDSGIEQMADTNGHAWFSRLIPLAGVLITLVVYGITLVTWTTRLDVRVSNVESEEVDLERLTKRMDTDGTQQMKLLEQRVRNLEQHNTDQDKRVDYIDSTVRNINERLVVQDERLKTMTTSLDSGQRKLDSILQILQRPNR